MRRLFSRRVLASAAVLAVLIGWIQLFEVEPVRPTVLLPTLPAPLTELAVSAKGKQAVYRADRERFVLSGPPDAVEDEKRRVAAAVERMKVPDYGADFVGASKDPATWRASRLSGLAVSCLTALRGGRVVVLPEPGSADRATYGVDRPEVTVRLTAGQAFEIRVGAASPGSTAHYFLCPETKVWGLLPGDVVTRLERLATRELPED